MTINFKIRRATAADLPAMLALLPRLAAFEIPPRRVPEDLWRGDATLVHAWERGEGRDWTLYVAAGNNDEVLGFSLARPRPELLSGEASAHLEILVVKAGVEGNGIGRALIEVTEEALARAGARTLTLHVFAQNARARRLYEQQGYEGEILRYIKDLAP